jgi:hypothetical protein
MERVWAEVIVVMTVRNTDVTHRSPQTFPRKELPVSSELNIDLNIEAVRSFQRSVNFYKTTRCQISEDILRTYGVFESRLLRIIFGFRGRVLIVSEFIYLR